MSTAESGFKQIIPAFARLRDGPRLCLRKFDCSGIGLRARNRGYFEGS